MTSNEMITMIEYTNYNIELILKCVGRLNFSFKFSRKIKKFLSITIRS